MSNKEKLTLFIVNIMSISSLFYTLLSVLEVLLVVVPSLMVVAFITIAERKTMASMQRRIGPNFVGVYGLLQALRLNNQRAFHTSLKRSLHFIPDSIKTIYNQAIKGLYKDKISPVIEFQDNILATCHNFINSQERVVFLKEWGTQGGLYLIQYKYDK